MTNIPELPREREARARANFYTVLALMIFCWGITLGLPLMVGLWRWAL